VSTSGFPLFRRFGVELEYMIVDRRSLNVRPVADELLRMEAGRQVSDVARGAIEWSNELALHVIELKTARPATSMSGLADRFQKEISHINRLLSDRGMMLLPTAMHPWMMPDRESRLWPHDNREIYATFDRIFGCGGHGWTNLQSVHLNLPFANDQEFKSLHTAIRLLLPLLPALAASSPFMEGRRATHLDTRLEVYRRNCERIPSITAGVVPEAVGSPAAYRRRILNRIRRDVRPHDPEGILDPEWTNARGAIARFCRNTIEIRVLDVQECPAADLALLEFAVAVLRSLTRETRSSVACQFRVPTRDLQACLRRTTRRGGQARVTSRAMRRALGFPSSTSLSVREVLEGLLAEVVSGPTWWQPTIRHILQSGSLAERLVRAVGPGPSPARLRRVYRELAECLQDGALFRA